MATCSLTAGIPLACLSSTGGIKNVHIAAFADDATFTLAGDVITASANTGTFYTFKFRAQNGDFTEEGNHSVETGTNFYTQTINLTFHKKETSKRNQLKVLAGTQMHVIVETQNGDYWLVGKANGAYLTASASMTGRSFGDLSGYTITLEASEPFQANEMDSATFGLLTVSA